MKPSRFLKDLFTTGFSQVVVLVSGILLLKIMAAGLNQEHFGMFIVVRRWIAVLLPVATANLTIALVRFVSYRPDQSRDFLRALALASVLLYGLTAAVLLIFHRPFSGHLFGGGEYGGLVLMLVLFLLGNVAHLAAYSYLRGKMEMNAAGLLRILFYGFPVPLALILTGITFARAETVLYLYFSLYSLWGVIISGYYLRKDLSGKGWKNPFAFYREKRDQLRDFFLYGFSRIPTVLFNALIFGFPVFIAARRLSLAAAGYLGIVVAVIRLMEVVAMPFNMILLPKFAALKKEQQQENQTGNQSESQSENHDKVVVYSRVVLEFILTFLPVLCVMLYGLSGTIIRTWFGADYLAPDIIRGTSVVLLGSMFYLAFALIRGILDGVFPFPLNNLISAAALLAGVLTALWFGTTVYRVSLSFAVALFVLGTASMVVLVLKLHLAFPWKTLLIALGLNIPLFLVLSYADALVLSLRFGQGYSTVLCLSYRALLAVGLGLFYWSGTNWYRQVMKRIR